MKTAFFLIFILQLSLSPFGQPLQPGGRAPSIKVGKWLKGPPLKEFEKGHIYLIQFWSTWCAPCKDAIPRLNSLADRFREQLNVIGVSIAERDSADVQTFMDRFGENVNYSLATDLVEKDSIGIGFMCRTWFQAARLRGIPSAFVIDQQGSIAFIGSLDSIETVIAAVVKGSWNISAFKQSWNNEFQKHRKEFELQQQYIDEDIRWARHPASKMVARVQKLKKNKNYQEALVILDSIENTPPSGISWANVKSISFQFKAEIYADLKLKDSCYIYLDKLLVNTINDTAENGAASINEIIWRWLVNPDGTMLDKKLVDYSFAIKWANQTVQKSKNPKANYFNTLAWACYQNGQKQEAIKIVEDALSVVTFDDFGKGKLEATLNAFKK